MDTQNPLENKNETLSFPHLKEGETALVSGFAGGPLSYRKKLLSMGLTPGTLFEVIRIAPLGDPVEIKVRQSFLSIRKAEAEIIKVCLQKPL